MLINWVIVVAMIMVSNFIFWATNLIKKDVLVHSFFFFFFLFILDKFLLTFKINDLGIDNINK